MEKKYLFPEKFWWGASTSATQTEGSEPDDGKEENIRINGCSQHSHYSFPNAFFMRNIIWSCSSLETFQSILPWMSVAPP